MIIKLPVIYQKTSLPLVKVSLSIVKIPLLALIDLYVYLLSYLYRRFNPVIANRETINTMRVPFSILYFSLYQPHLFHSSIK